MHSSIIQGDICGCLNLWWLHAVARVYLLGWWNDVGIHCSQQLSSWEVHVMLPNWLNGVSQIYKLCVCNKKVTITHPPLRPDYPLQCPVKLQMFVPLYLLFMATPAQLQQKFPQMPLLRDVTFRQSGIFRMMPVKQWIVATAPTHKFWYVCGVTLLICESN